MRHWGDTGKGVGGDSQSGRTRAHKSGRAIKVAIFFFFFLAALQHFFFLVFFKASELFWETHVRVSTLWKRRGSRVCAVAAAALILLFATFYPRPPRAHFLPAGPKIEARVLFVLPRSGASRCSSSSAVVDSGGFCAAPLLDASFFHFLSLSSLFSFQSLAMNHLSERISEMSREEKDEDILLSRPSSV